MIYIVASTFYEELSDELIEGAVNVISTAMYHDPLTSTSAPSKIKVIKVPGAFEIPGMVKQLLDNKKADLIITLGVIIKGETNHFEQISDFVFDSISKLTISSDVPIAFGVISAQNYDQAEKRALIKYKNKGREVAHAGVNMLSLYEKYKK